MRRGVKTSGGWSTALFASLSLVSAGGSLACGPALHSRAAGAVSPLAVRAVDWNPSRADVGQVRAVADDGDVVAVFSDRGATVFSARAPVAVDRAVTDWTSAAAIVGADGAARWIVGISRKGRMYYLRGLSAFEDVTARYGLGSAPIRGATSLGERDVGFLLDGAVAVADGAHVTRYAEPTRGATFAELTGGGGVGAGVVRDDGIDVFDIARKSIVHYPLRGAREVAVGADGRVYAATARGVYAADGAGKLALVYDASTPTIHGLVASGALDDAGGLGVQVWFADGDELGVISGSGVAETHGAKIGRDAKLAASSSGDVWVLSGGGLQRFAASSGGAPASGVSRAWDAAIAPIFARSCSGCHLPDGASGTDLSTATAWAKERSEIRERVVEKRTMPPEGHPLAEADRRAIRAWLDAEQGGGPSPAGAR